MALNYIWVAFFLIAFILAIVKLIFFGDTLIFTRLVESTFEMSKTGFEISLGLTGVLALWMGLMNVGEKGGATKILSRLIAPFFHKLYPEIPRNHPVFGAITMNFAANMLNLDNAATPLGLKAMEELQELNPHKDVASNAQIMFLVLNTSALTIIPVTIMVYRSQMGAANPADVFIPLLIATFCSTIAGLIAVSFYQKLNLLNSVVLAYLGSITVLIAGMMYFFSNMTPEQIGEMSALGGNLIIFSIIILFLLLALRQRINIFTTFVDGAKEGFITAVKIIPYLIAMLVAIGVFRTSGAMDYLTDGISWVVAALGINTDFVPALPTGLMKPLSGSGARGLLIETMTIHGADSFPGRVASVMQGATDTTFYVLAVYFGAVNITKTRHALVCGLIADFAGIIAAIAVSYFFFHR